MKREFVSNYLIIMSGMRSNAAANSNVKPRKKLRVNGYRTLKTIEPRSVQIFSIEATKANSLPAGKQNEDGMN